MRTVCRNLFLVLMAVFLGNSFSYKFARENFHRIQWRSKICTNKRRYLDWNGVLTSRDKVHYKIIYVTLACVGAGHSHGRNRPKVASTINPIKTNNARKN